MRFLRLAVVIFITLLFALPGAGADEQSLNLEFNISETDPIELRHGHRCQDFSVWDHQFFGDGISPRRNPAEAEEVISVPIYETSNCKVLNLWGAVGGNVSAFEAKPNEPYHVRGESGWSTWHANQTDTTLSLKRAGGSGQSNRYIIAVTPKHLSKGSVSYQQDSQNRWLRWLNIPEPDPYLSYSDGISVKVKGAFLTPNGRYVVLDIYRRGIAIYDIYNQTLKPVTSSYGYDNNFTNLTLSDDGRYLVVSGQLRSNRTNRELLLYDTTGCQKSSLSTLTSSSLFAPSGCRSMNLKQYISDNYKPVSVSGDVWTNPNKNEVVVGVRVQNPDGSNQFNTLSLTPKNDTSPAGYLAMGDSYTSGEGDGDGDTWYEPDTDNQGTPDTYIRRNLCHLSRRSYPYLIASQLGYDTTTTAEPDALFHSVACSGARIHNIIGGNLGEKHTAGHPSEFERTDNQYIFNNEFNLASWQPGATKQIKSLTAATFSPRNSIREMNPEIVTIGISGNDAGFGDFFKACAAKPTDCSQTDNTSEEAYKTATRIAAQKRRLVNTYELLKKHSNARIYVHGYPLLFTTQESYCANVPLSEAERSFANSATAYLNQIIETAAAEAGVVYIDVEDMFNNQQLCDRGQDLMNGATYGDDIFELPFIKKRILGNESFHPTQNGFQMYKTTILEQTTNLTLGMPPPQANLQIPLPPSDVFGTEAVEYVNKLNNVFDYTQLPIPEQREMIIDPIGGTFTLQLDGLAPNSTAIVEVHSDPIKLGQFDVDNNGVLHTSINLPELEPGYHELLVETTTVNGQRTNFYESFVLASSETDFDGDGIANQDDGCPTISSTETDSDNDGTPDSCDPVIEASYSTPGNSPDKRRSVPNTPGLSQSQQSIAKNATSRPQHDPGNEQKVKAVQDGLRQFIDQTDESDRKLLLYAGGIACISGLVLLTVMAVLRRK